MSALTDPLERDGWVRFVGADRLRCTGAHPNLPGRRCGRGLVDLEPGTMAYARPAIPLWPAAPASAARAFIVCMRCATRLQLLFVTGTTGAGGVHTFPTSQA